MFEFDDFALISSNSVLATFAIPDRLFVPRAHSIRIRRMRGTRVPFITAPPLRVTGVTEVESKLFWRAEKRLYKLENGPRRE